MKTRCTSTTRTDAKHYRLRGISYFPEWELFENFLRDMGERPAGMSLDRINNNEGYEPNNCRWATVSQQRKNRRFPKRKEGN